MTLPFIPPVLQRESAPPRLKASARFRVQARRGLDALTGQAATLVRASTATITDSAGATVTIGHSMPRLESRTWLGAPAIGVRLGTDDLTYPLDWLPETGTLFVEGINLGTAQTNGRGLVYLGRDDATGARLVVRGTGTTLAVDFINAGGLTSTATLGSAVANGAAFHLVVQLDDDGTNQRVRIGGAVNGTPVALSAYGTARARAAAWGTEARCRVNRVGSAGSQGDVWLRQLAWHAGLLTVDEMGARL